MLEITFSGIGVLTILTCNFNQLLLDQIPLDLRHQALRCLSVKLCTPNPATAVLVVTVACLVTLVFRVTLASLVIQVSVDTQDQA